MAGRRTHLHWFSPLPPARTDIANFTMRSLGALSKAYRVTLWTDQEKWDPALDKQFEIHSFRPGGEMPWPKINGADICIYQIGNNGSFHSGIIEILLRHPGIVVMHDVNIHECTRHFFLEQRSSQQAYFETLREYEGDEAVKCAREYCEGRFERETLDSRYPLNQWLTANAWGVVIHNPTALPEVRAATDAPILVADLPFLEQNAIRPLVRRSLPAGCPLRIVTFGFLHGENRRLIPTLRALATLPQDLAWHYTIIGEYDEAFVTRQLRELGIQKQVSLRGFLTEHALAEALDESHLALNFRHPTRGEASGSMLRIWNHGLPSLVSPNAYFGTLPDSVAAKVRPDHEEADIHRHINAFHRDPDSFFEMGAAGHERLKSFHTTERYAADFSNFVPEVLDYAGRAYRRPWSRRLGKKIIGRMPTTLQGTAATRLSQRLDGLWKFPE